MNRTYNAATGIPVELVDEVLGLSLELVWSRHAKQEAVNDKYGVLPPEAYPRAMSRKFFAPTALTGGGWLLVEVEANAAGRAVKFVIRRPVDATRSLVLVILRDGPFIGLVKTCWSNLNSDTHKTLDKSRLALV